MEYIPKCGLYLCCKPLNPLEVEIKDLKTRVFDVTNSGVGDVSKLFKPLIWNPWLKPWFPYP